MNNFKALYLLLLPLIFFGCEEDEIPKPLNNSELLFVNSRPFHIDQIHESDVIGFEIQEDQSRYSFVALFEAPPLIVEGELANPENIIWSWQGESFAGKFVALENGTYRDGQLAVNNEYLQCNNQQIYWAAWGWDQTAQYITFSTPPQQELFTTVELPTLSLVSIQRISETPNDTLLVPGEEITLRLDFANSGTAPLGNATVAIIQPDIISLPLAIALPELNPGEQHSELLTFTLPGGLSFGDQLTFQAEMTYNNCLNTNDEFELFINALKVCIYDVQLLDIRYIPAAIFWDPGAFPIYWDPDVFYELFAPNNQLLHHSETIEDATDDWPNTPILADWVDISPCQDLKLDSTYTINFWDEDAFDPDDFIGSFSFKPLDFLQQREEEITFTNDEVMAKIFLRWE